MRSLKVMNRIRPVRAALLVLALGMVTTGCRGFTFSQTPVHPNPNMDNVTYVSAQEPSEFFDDGRGMRPQVDGTVAVGELREDDHMYRGVVNGAWATTLPDAVIDAWGDDEATAVRAGLERGQARYNIYCTPCHGEAGLENGGIVAARGLVSGDWSWAVPTLHGERQRGYTIGQLYDLISNGYNTMPGYAAQIPVEDRWAIATYVRALQISQGAPRRSVPAEIAREQGW